MSIAQKTRTRSKQAKAWEDGDFGPASSPQTALSQYYSDLDREPMIDAQREIELGHRAKAGDEVAIDELVRANLRFVIMVAKKFQGCGLDLDDLIQEGNAGLLNAAQKFDPDQGVRFISYAVWWVRQHLQTAVANHGRNVRLPSNRVVELRRMKRARQEFQSTHRREPSAEELAETLGMTLQNIHLLERLRQAEMSFDAPIKEESESSLIDRHIEDDAHTVDEEVETNLIRERINRVLGGLPEREAYILKRYFGLDDRAPDTLEQIGAQLGLTRERIRQIRDKTLKRLREGEEGRVLFGLR